LPVPAQHFMTKQHHCYFNIFSAVLCYCYQCRVILMLSVSCYITVITAVLLLLSVSCYINVI